jgi:hypothetical protein
LSRWTIASYEKNHRVVREDRRQGGVVDRTQVDRTVDDEVDLLLAPGLQPLLADLQVGLDHVHADQLLDLGVVVLDDVLAMRAAPAAEAQHLGQVELLEQRQEPAVPAPEDVQAPLGRAEAGRIVACVGLGARTLEQSIRVHEALRVPPLRRFWRHCTTGSGPVSSSAIDLRAEN